MSDPVTNVEIEDVLSSIRRLVSNGQHGRGAKPAEPYADPQPEERLVLTPALRIDDNSPAADPDSFVWKDMLEDAKTSAQWGVTGSGPASESESGSMENSDIGERPVDAPIESGGLFQSSRAPQPRPLRPAAAQTDAAAPLPEEDARDSTPLGLEAQVAEFEAAVASRDDQWDPDGTSDDALSAQPVPTLEWRDVIEDTADAPAGQASSPEPDGDTPDGAPSEAPAPADAAPDRTDSAAQGPDNSPDETPPPDARTAEVPQGLSLDDTILDEDSLRDLVAEIVREELQGALGERITRNVRKLVRREIHRALTSQDFD